MKRKFTIILVVLNIFYIFSQQNSNIYINDWITPPPKNPDTYPLIYVDFWATWCAPCISSMPHTEQLEKKYGENVLFLFLSQEPAGKVKEFMQKRNKNFISAVNPDGATFEKYQIRYIPQSLIIGPYGKVVWHGQPLDLNEKILNDLLEKYGHIKPRPGRIQHNTLKETEEDWKIFTQDEFVLQYAPAPGAPNEFIEKEGYFYLSGSLPYIASVIKGVPEPLVKTDLKNLPQYRFTSTVQNREIFNGLVQSFICRETPYKIKKEKTEKKVYVLKDKASQNLFSDQMYDFEQGNNVPLIDEFGIMIDNATKSQMADWLSQTTGEIFLYEGNDNKIYDWNISYKNTDDLIRALTDDLGFDVSPQTRETVIYVIIRKR